jgi:hypothetical protein
MEVMAKEIESSEEKAGEEQTKLREQVPVLVGTR